MPSDPAVKQLSRFVEIDSASVMPPLENRSALPEKILQFGTGVFLRGFSDALVDRANREGTFQGSIVVVGSTGSGRCKLINEQDGLYTVAEQGVDKGEVLDRCTVVSSVSRAISAVEDWVSVLDVARNPDLEVVISNTTEVGIRFDSDDRADLTPPQSFPGKLAVFLHERAQTFDFAPEAGLTILCCELIDSNGDRLREIILRLSERWSFEDGFAEWILAHNTFCNTLVDRIVPGAPAEPALQALEQRIGYRDTLLVQAEPFYFWAIEGDDEIRRRLRFLKDDPHVVVAQDIEPFRVRKVRTLNGTHSIMVPLSFLCGNDTVAETMENTLTSAYLRRVLLDEIVPSLDGDLDGDEAETFAHQVLDRFANPFIHHNLLNIALQQTSKMDERVVPSLVAFTQKVGRLPEAMLLGFAAFLLFVTRHERAGEVELPADERADRVRAHWQETGGTRIDAFVKRVLADRELWHHPLDELPGFSDRLSTRVREMHHDGVAQTLEAFQFAKNGHST